MSRADRLDALLRELVVVDAIPSRLYREPVGSSDIAFDGALAALAGVAKVERVDAMNGHIRLRALPKPGATIAPDVGALLRDQSIVVEELLVERGKLDDVFREITTSREGARHA